MLKFYFSITLILLFFASDLSTKNHSGKDSIDRNGYALIEAFPALTFDLPVELTSPGDNSNRIFVVEQKGVIRTFQNSHSTRQSAIFLDIEKQVSSGGEMGLLGLAFHPEYKTNGYFYLNYTRRNPLETVISRFRVRIQSKHCRPEQ